MDRIGAGDRRGREDRRDIQIAVARRRRADADGLVGEPHIHRIGVGGRMHRHRLDPHLAAGAMNAQRNLAAIGDQHLLEHQALMPSPPFRGEREGTRRVSDGEGEVGLAAGSFPHLTPTLSAPEGGEGDFELPAYRLQHAPNIFHYIPVPEPDHAIASLGDFPAARLVCARFEARAVRHRAQSPASPPDRRSPQRISRSDADDEIGSGARARAALATAASRPPSYPAAGAARASSFVRTLTRSASGRRHTRPAARRQPGSARCGRRGARGSGSSPSSPR